MTIGSGDIEHYFADEVMTLAKSFATKPWEELGDRTRRRLINQAIKAFGALMNDELSKAKIYEFLDRNHYKGDNG